MGGGKIKLSALKSETMSSDWARLYSQGRCKAFGVPWSDEEANAVFILKIPADFVRRGCLTQEQYEKEKEGAKKSIEKTGKIPLVHLRREQLAQLCAKEGITITEDAPKASLIEVLLSKGFAKSVPIDMVT